MWNVFGTLHFFTLTFYFFNLTINLCHLNTIKMETQDQKSVNNYKLNGMREQQLGIRKPGPDFGVTGTKRNGEGL